MLNYIRAEFYKLMRRKYTYITLGVMLILESLLVACFTFHNAHSLPTPFSEAAIIIVALGSIGFCICLLTGDIVFAGQYKNSTLKNEVSFGLSRTRIYLGKLIAQTLLSLIYLVMMIGFYLALCAAVLPHNAEGFPTDTRGLTIVGYFLAVGLPLWIGGQAAACMCQFLVNGDMAASFVYVGLVFVLDAMVELVGLLAGGAAGNMLLEAHEYFPCPMLNAASSVVGDWAYLGKAWLVGAVWVAVCTAVGLRWFSKKEIN